MKEHFRTENKGLDVELNVYATLFLAFNDDNTDHLQSNMVAKGCFNKTAQEMRLFNVHAMKEILDCGITENEISQVLDKPEEYILEAKSL